MVFFNGFRSQTEENGLLHLIGTVAEPGPPSSSKPRLFVKLRDNTLALVFGIAEALFCLCGFLLASLLIHALVRGVLGVFLDVTSIGADLDVSASLPAGSTDVPSTTTTTTPTTTTTTLPTFANSSSSTFLLDLVTPLLALPALALFTLFSLAAFLGVPCGLLRGAVAAQWPRRRALMLISLQILFFFAILPWRKPTLANFSGPGGPGFSLPRALELLLYAPLREELVFRLVIVAIVANRCTKSNRAPIIFSGVLFGCAHLANVNTGRFSPAYIMTQTLLGSLVGAVFASDLLATGNLSGSVAMHVANNVMSGLTRDASETSLFRDNIDVIAVLVSVVAHAAALFSPVSKPLGPSGGKD